MIWDILFRAFIVGALLSILLSIMSYFVVMRKMTFAGVGIAHSAFGGIALSFFFGFAGYFFPLLFSLAAALFIAFMYKKGRISEDSAIDVIFVFSMAFGVFILSISDGYSANMLGILFGNILSVSTTDMEVSLVVFIFGFLFMSYYFSHFQLMSYNEELAYISGIKVDLLYYLFWVVLSIVIVLSIKLIGIILVNAFLVLPTLVGLNISRNYKGIIFSAVLSSILSIAAGISAAYVLDTPAGATIVLVFICIWAASIAYRKLKG
jgi:zinc transport system permease protein